MTVSAGSAVAANLTSNLANSTNLDDSTSFRLTCACASAPVEGATVALYLVPKLDGTNLAGVDLTTPYINPNYLVGYFVWPAASSASSQIMDIYGVALDPYDYAAYLVNNLGQTINSGWSLISYGARGQYT